MKNQTFNKNWLFGMDTADWRKVSLYKAVTLPHDFSIAQERKTEHRSQRDGGYSAGGYGNYKKELILSQEESKQTHILYFDGIYGLAEVSINGSFVGRHPYGYTGFYYDITPYLHEGTNHISVGVDNSMIPNSRWYSGSGIYRNVTLLTSGNCYIAPWGVAITALTEQISAKITVDGTVDTTAMLQTKIYDNTHTVVATIQTAITQKEIAIAATLPNVQVWSAEHPSLYTMENSLIAADNTILDTTTTVFGVRNIEVDAENGLRINGQSVTLKGGCVHHDNGILGSASYVRSEERKVELLKKSGFNAIRCAHNPPSTVFLEVCDRLGMYVIDEAFDCWKRGKTQYDYHLYFNDWFERDITSMVTRDRNHPAVIIWSIGNEICEQCGDSNAYETAQQLSTLIRSLDTTRPITMAVCPVGDDNWRKLDGTLASLDIAGYNYSHGRYEPDHALLPNRIMMGTETVPQDAYEHWCLTEKLPYVVGEFVWTSMDYLGEAGIGRVYYEEEKDGYNHLYDYPWNRAYCGDIDCCGFKRPQSYYRDIVWGISDTPYIAVRQPVADPLVTERITYWGWNDNAATWDFSGQEGKTMLVDVYSSGETVELFLNGKSLGIKSLYADKEAKKSGLMPRYAAVYEVPYEAGELVAVADNGKKCSLKSADKPCRIQMTPDRPVIDATYDLCYIEVSVTDKDGVVRGDAFNKIFFSVSGAGELLAVGSPNPKDTEPYVGNIHTVYRGKAMVCIRSNGTGAITIHAIADGLSGSVVTIQAK